GACRTPRGPEGGHPAEAQRGRPGRRPRAGARADRLSHGRVDRPGPCLGTRIGCGTVRLAEPGRRSRLKLPHRSPETDPEREGRGATVHAPPCGTPKKRGDDPVTPGGPWFDPDVAERNRERSTTLAHSHRRRPSRGGHPPWLGAGGT